jgi:hypothetical protein
MVTYPLIAFVTFDHESFALRKFSGPFTYPFS